MKPTPPSGSRTRIHSGSNHPIRDMKVENQIGPRARVRSGNARLSISWATSPPVNGANRPASPILGDKHNKQQYPLGNAHEIYPAQQFFETMKCRADCNDASHSHQVTTARKYYRQATATLRRPLIPITLSVNLIGHQLLFTILAAAIILMTTRRLYADQTNDLAARVSLNNSYLDEQGKVLEHYDTICDVFVGKGSFFIRPMPANCPSNVVLGAVAISPYSHSNFVSGYSMPFNSNLFSEVIVAKSPSQCDIGFDGHLLKLAYVPAADYAEAVSSNEFLYIPGEAGSHYSPSEIVFVVQYTTNVARSLPSAVKAYSPDYYYIRPGKKQAFRGRNRNRLLWEYKVIHWTNALGSTFPLDFSYVRYNDAERRIVLDNQRPIVICKGRLECLIHDAGDRFEQHLSQTLVVTDVRRAEDTYGRPLIYTVTNRTWLDEQSPEFAAMVKVIRSRVEREQKDNRVSQVNPTVLFCVFAIILFLPLVLLVKPKSKNQ